MSRQSGAMMEAVDVGFVSCDENSMSNFVKNFLGEFLGAHQFNWLRSPSAIAWVIILEPTTPFEMLAPVNKT